MSLIFKRKYQKLQILVDRIYYRAPLLIPFGIPTQIFFSDTRHQKRPPAGEAGSLASLNEYFGNEVAGEKPMLGNKMELLETP